ncbi:uncharacterized protein LOC135492786 [Lineus longissimus]|uniref:uncharacterized protein LOC135492786 n=1 Tax=Lineus longissimus TaxID=88925 RepID=UPI00315C5F73
MPQPDYRMQYLREEMANDMYPGQPCSMLTPPISPVLSQPCRTTSYPYLSPMETTGGEASTSTSAQGVLAGFQQDNAYPLPENNWPVCDYWPHGLDPLRLPQERGCTDEERGQRDVLPSCSLTTRPRITSVQHSCVYNTFMYEVDEAEAEVVEADVRTSACSYYRSDGIQTYRENTVSNRQMVQHVSVIRRHEDIQDESRDPLNLLDKHQKYPKQAFAGPAGDIDYAHVQEQSCFIHDNRVPLPGIGTLCGESTF